MKTSSAVLCTGCFLAPTCHAFVAPSYNAGSSALWHQKSKHNHHQDVTASSREAQQYARDPFSRVSGGVARLPRTRRIATNMSSLSASDGESAPGRSAAMRPSGPGAGVIDLQFGKLKAGGFKVFLLFFLLGQGRAKDNATPFSVRDTPEGIRILIGDEKKNESQWEGVLDLSWGTEPRPFFRVDRIDVKEVIPYVGELYILNKLLDAIIDVNGEQSVSDEQKLFLFQPGEQSQLAATKAKLATWSSL